MKTNIFKRAISVMTCLAVVIAMAPGLTYKADAVTYFNYVAIGDMTTSGYGLSGFDDDIQGFLQNTEGAYPSQVKSKLSGSVKLTTLAGGEMRPDELDAILNSSHKDDEYTTDKFSGENGDALFKTWANQIDNVSVKTAAAGEKQLRTYYTDKIESADLITYSLGAVSLGRFITMGLTETDYPEADIEKLLSNLGLEDEEISDMNISSIKSETRAYVKSVLKRNNVTVSESQAEELADRVIYAGISFVCYFDKNIEKIREINPDCDIVVVGLYNCFENIEVEYDGKTIELGEITEKLIDKINLCMSSVSEYSDEYYFADINEEDIDTFKDNLNNIKSDATLLKYLNKMIGDIVSETLEEDADYSALADHGVEIAEASQSLYDNQSNYNKLISQWDKDIKGYEEEISKLDDEISKLEKEIKSINTQMKEMISDPTKEEEYVKLKSQAEELSDEKSDLEHEKSDLQKKIVGFDEYLADYGGTSPFKALGKVVKESDILSSESAATTILGWGFTEAEILELGYLYNSGNDIFAKRFNDILDVHKDTVKEKLGTVKYIAFMGFVTPCETISEFKEVLEEYSDYTGTTLEEVDAGFTKCGETVDRIYNLGKIRDLMLECVDTDKAIDGSMISQEIDISSISKEFEDVVEGTQKELSDDTKRLINVFFQFVYPDGNSLAIQPNKEGHSTIAEVIYTAYKEKNTSSNEVASTSSLEYTKTDSSFYTSIGDSVATGYGVAESENYTTALAGALELTESQYKNLGIEGARVSDLLYMLGESSVKDSYTDTLTSNVTASEYQNYIKNSDLITVGAGLDGLSRYLLWAKKTESYEPDFSRFEDSDEEEIDAFCSYAKQIMTYISSYNESGYTEDEIERMAKAFAYANISMKEDYEKVLAKIHKLNSNAKVVIIGVYNAAEGAYFQDGSKYKAEIGKLCDAINSEINEEIRDYAKDNSSWCGYANTYGLASRMIFNDNGTKVNYNIHDGKYIDFATENDSVNVHPSARGHQFIKNGILNALGRESICSHILKQISAKASTINAQGNIAYYYCDECGKYFTDKAGKKEISKEATVTPCKVNVTYANLYGKCNQVKVRWDRVDGAKSYTVSYKASTASKWTTKNVTTVSATLSGLKAGAKYSIKVQAKNASGNLGTASATKTVYTVGKMAAPKVVKSGSKVKVSWSKQTGVTGYQISKKTSKSGTSTVATITKQSTSSKTLTATKKKTYYYKVRAYKTVDGKKIYGAWSAAKSYKLK